MRRWLLPVFGLHLALAVVEADGLEVADPPAKTDDDAETLAEQLKVLQKEVSEAHEEWREASRKTQDLRKKLADAEATNTREKYWRTQAVNAAVADSQKFDAYKRKSAENAFKALALARRNPKSVHAAEALDWAAQGVERSHSEVIKNIVALVQEFHLESPKIRLLVNGVGHVGWGDLPDEFATNFLTAVAEKNSDSATKATALMGLAARYRARAEPYGRPIPVDATEWRKTAEQTLERVAGEFGDVIFYRDMSFGDKAGAELFELRNLVIGKTAPEIEGKDLDGGTFKLSDYRGRVVVLSFWGDW